MTPAIAASTLTMIATLCYILVCVVSPFGPCRRCDGLGFQLKTTRAGKPKRGKSCRRCKATGRRLRFGRRITNAYTRVHRAGTR